MKLLTEELDEYSLQIKGTKQEIVRLNKIYKQCFDRELRKELIKQRLKLKKLKRKLKDSLYQNIEELRLLKIHFPEFFKQLEQDAFLSSQLKQMKWLLDFKELPEQEAENGLNSIREKRKQLKKAKKQITSFVKLDFDSLKKFEVLKNILEKSPSKDELLELMEKEDKSLKRKGWLIILNDPFIEIHTRAYFGWYRDASADENKLHQSYLEATKHGSLAESAALNNLKDARKKRKKIERKFKHMLYANPSYLRKLKSSKRFMSDFSNFEHNFIDSIEMKNINEIRWVEQMKKLLNL